MMLLQLFSYVGVCGCARDDDTNAEEGLENLHLQKLTINHANYSQTDDTPRSGIRQWCVLENLSSSSRRLEDKEQCSWPWFWHQQRRRLLRL